jgi:hypothetical protein
MDPKSSASSVDQHLKVAPGLRGLYDTKHIFLFRDRQVKFII